MKLPNVDGRACAIEAGWRTDSTIDGLGSIATSSVEA